MPFAWFISTLKSVDPALIAVLIDNEIHVSHHYLGIDDARVLSQEDLPKYIQVRQKERKETHLLYVQSPSRKRKSIDKSLKDLEITTQSLLSDSTDDTLLDVVQAVLTKGTESLGELLHFEMEFAGKTEDNQAAVPATVPAVSELPPPQPPAALQRVQPSSEDSQTESPVTDAAESQEPIIEDTAAAAAGMAAPTVPAFLRPPAETVIEPGDEAIDLEQMAEEADVSPEQATVTPPEPKEPTETKETAVSDSELRESAGSAKADQTSQATQAATTAAAVQALDDERMTWPIQTNRT